ncbi:TetR family transcriptional regulator [Gammaproteobacteria bacterium]|jgi:AcrR family transcriptional regulator|nr:TetR family transcriptional regulator [Gammaproteobacteria bacterium]MDB3868408.1 TetR family transcriptional regulator [Gammaproteobacteria bacterium]MDC0440501.1 TetR family transcriptional regulator [Gammaproteobacteria bacterium]MDC0884326.1 TetR/AcrR family transcriptional regulator [Gammaproteobacteria bacterium]|tara:strand:- start:2295 stop:2885 length:591 start_codon:yes stop_codon:yes gene_type:complete
MDKSTYKGRKNVEKQLINSAAELVGSIGPNQLSIRDIADHAGVNHAQIHHYFGGKQGLLEATYKQLAFEHMEQLERRNVNPDNLGKEPLSDITDNYFRAIIRAVLDKKMDLVRIQVDAGYSMSRKTLAELTKLSGLKKPTAEIKAAVALVMALEFGYASMKDYIKEVLKISDKDLPVFMNLFYEARELGLKKILQK